MLRKIDVVARDTRFFSVSIDVGFNPHYSVIKFYELEKMFCYLLVCSSIKTVRFNMYAVFISLN